MHASVHVRATIDRATLTCNEERREKKTSSRTMILNVVAAATCKSFIENIRVFRICGIHSDRKIGSVSYTKAFTHSVCRLKYMHTYAVLGSTLYDVTCDTRTQSHARTLVYLLQANHGTFATIRSDCCVYRPFFSDHCFFFPLLFLSFFSGTRCDSVKITTEILILYS